MWSTWVKLTEAEHKRALCNRVSEVHIRARTRTRHRLGTFVTPGSLETEEIRIPLGDLRDYRAAILQRREIINTHICAR